MEKQTHVTIRKLGLEDYGLTLKAMQTFTELRSYNTPDEIWLLEHHPVFTQGLHGKDDHVLARDHEIPIIQSDRGGFITYHGPGQIIAYILVDLKRRKIGVRRLVNDIENALIKTLLNWNIFAEKRDHTPGVFVGDKKIASLGLRIRRGCSYHGLSLNVDMDLSPWKHINPCGLNVSMTQLKDFVRSDICHHEIATLLTVSLCNALGYKQQKTVTTCFSVAD